MSERDPRWNPKAGDVLRLAHLDERYEVVAVGDGYVMDKGVPNESGCMQEGIFTNGLDTWRSFMIGAKVLHVAD